MASRKTKFDGYTKDDTLSTTQRVAHFLDWAADNHPGSFMSYPEIVQAITGQRSMPRLNSTEVQQIKRATAAGVRQALITKYDREVVSLPGVGIRATYSDADRLEYVAPKKAKRLESARRGFILTATAINLKNVPDTPAYAPLKQWMRLGVNQVLKLVGDPSFAQKLLPPSTEPTEQ